jgi:large subunit ribosomal protein L25
MAEMTIEVARREGTGKEIARKLRREGKIPAIVYGGHREPVAITVDQKTISELFKKGEHGIRSLFLLKMADSDQKRHAMIKDIQIDQTTRKMRHIDFIRVVMDEMVKVTIPVHVIGVPAGVKTEGGMVDFQTRELHIECLPDRIPDSFDVDVSNLRTHEFIRVSDIKVPEGVKIVDDPDRMILAVSPARVEEPVEGAEEAEEPEVIKKGKADEEEQ